MAKATGTKRKLLVFAAVFAAMMAITCITSWGSTVTAGNSTGGTLKLAAASANAGDTVTGTVTPASGYDLATVRVEAGGQTTYATIDGTNFSFKMPSGNAKVTAAFFSTTKWDGAVDISWYDPDATEYNIGTPAQLAGLAALVNGRIDADTPEYMIKGDKSLLKSEPIANQTLVGSGGGNVVDTVYTSTTDFAYKTVYLTADLDMGGVYNSSTTKWSGPNYTPIGGKFPMDIDMVDGDCYVIDTRFNGVLDGQGHTVSNVYCNRYSEKGFAYSMAIGLVGYLGGSSDTGKVSAEFKEGWQPAVRNIVMGKGSIYGRRMVGGLVGRTGDASNGFIIENCGNYATIKNTDSKGVGGILGTAGADGVVRNCYNVGSVSTTFSCPAAGIIGSNGGADIYNCYNSGTINSNGAAKGCGIGNHYSGSYTVDNCYTLEGCDDDTDSEGYYTSGSNKIEVNVVQMSADQMKSQSLADKLNVSGKVFIWDSSKNNGYPILFFEKSGFDASTKYTVTVKQPTGGKISVTTGDTAAAGQVVGFNAEPDPGYKLDYYTVNGEKSNSDFRIADGNMEISAVFSKVKNVKITFPQSDLYSLVVATTGYDTDGTTTKEVTAKILKSGDSVMEGNRITVRAYVYSGKLPEDPSLEYTGPCQFKATNVETVNAYTCKVTGEGDIEIEIIPNTQEKTWISQADTSWYKVKNSTYEISTAQQLAGLAYLVNEQGLNFEGKTIKLTADINLANNDGTKGARNWEPIGLTAKKSFNGTFDGAGHAVCSMTSSRKGSYGGLFGYVTNATLKNLIVTGTSTCTANMAYAGGIAAYASGTKFEKCVNYVDVTVQGEIAGGVCAYSENGSTFTSCENHGKISASAGAGGILGCSSDPSDTLKACCNFGAVVSTGSSTGGCGGIVGKLTGKAEGCINTASVSGTDRYIGGIAGYTCGRKTSALTDCQNTGSVSSSSTGADAACGGAAGYAQYVTMKDCSNTGAVTAGTGFVSKGIGAVIGKPGSELCTAANCVYKPGSCVGGANSGTYTGISESSSITAKAVTNTPAPSETPALAPYEVSASAGAANSEICGGSTLSEAGTYYLCMYAAGELVIADGIAVTLVGTDKVLGDLRITAGKGVSLTLQDVVFTGDTTLLTLQGDATITAKGTNAINGTSDAQGNTVPTILAKGSLTFNGPGSLRVGACLGNACITMETKGSSLRINSGRLSIFKDGLLGTSEGGGITAPGSNIVIDGGALEGRTNSDNINVAYASGITLNSGSINATSSRAPKLLTGSPVKLPGGIVRASGHSGKSSPTSYATYGKDCISGLSGSGNFMSETPAPGSTVLSKQKIVVNGESVNLEVYNIDGYNYFKLRDMAGLMEDTDHAFSVSYDGDLKSMYTTTGEVYQPVGGELLTGSSKASTCVASTWTLYVNNALKNCKVYNIGGNNFFMLRDLGEAYGLEIGYDKKTNTATVKG